MDSERDQQLEAARAGSSRGPSAAVIRARLTACLAVVLRIRHRSTGKPLGCGATSVAQGAGEFAGGLDDARRGLRRELAGDGAKEGYGPS
jgi:hypothetical protein